MSKEQMTIRLYPETRRQMDSWLEESNSKNRNEFVEKALRFYMGYLGTENITEYLSDALVATLRGIIADSANRTNGILFKCAVEQGIMAHTMDHMLPMLDGDLTKIGVEHMKKMGMEFHLECPVQAVESSSVGAKVICKNKAGETVSFEAEKVLVAIGRKANTAMLDLDTGKLDNDRGRIKVNDKMETSVPGVYAIGDCVMGYAQLAHTASAMGEVAAENICGHEAHYDESTNPTCVYIEPEAASVGLTEEQCKAKGIAYKVGKFPMSANGKALILNGGEGLVKLIAGAKYGEILGMHIIGPRATDLISEGALAIRLEATVDELISTIHSHPTVTETLREAALNFDKRAIHMKN